MNNRNQPNNFPRHPERNEESKTAGYTRPPPWVLRSAQDDGKRGIANGGHKPPLPLSGFTLLELLSVLAILGILAALIFPSVGAARRSASKAKTRVQFTQWTAAIESFRGEYGFYPAFDPSNLVNGGVTATDHPFHDLLSAKKRDGTALAVGSGAALQNRKSVSFYSFTDADFTPAGVIRDAFDNTAMAVLVDRDLDGVIRQGTDFVALPTLGGIAPGGADYPATGVRAGVIFYAPAPGATTANPEFIFSWK